MTFLYFIILMLIGLGLALAAYYLAKTQNPNAPRLGSRFQQPLAGRSGNMQRYQVEEKLSEIDTNRKKSQKAAHFRK